MSALRDPARLPSALGDLDRISARVRGRSTAVFLDFDGTLAPIVRRPEEARLPDGLRPVLERLASRVPVAVVSGRDREDVAGLVGIDRLLYAGSHGLDISGPDGLRLEHDEARRFLPDLEEAGRTLERALAGLSGIRIERKRFGLAIHFRNVDPERVPEVLRAVDETRKGGNGRLSRHAGRKVVELRPGVDWDKGRAVVWLLDRIGAGDAVPIYVGDDITDEDGFRAVDAAGIGVLVGLPPRTTHAAYRLEGPEEVPTFLVRLAGILESER